MILIDLDSIQFYYPLTKADLAGKRPSIASISNIPVIYKEGYTPTVSRSNGGWGGLLNDYDLIEVLESTGSSSKDPLDLLSYKRAQELQQSGLRLGEDKGANTDSSSSVYSRSDGSTSEQGGRHCSLNTLRLSEAGSEAGYDP